jgi:hypothetical protein
MKPFDDEPAPVIGFLVRFFFGALFGAVASFVAMESGPDWTGMYITMSAASVICGLLAAFFGDEFWKKF